MYCFQAGLDAVNIVVLRWGQVSVRVKIRVREILRDTNLQIAFLDVARWQKGLVTTELCTCFFGWIKLWPPLLVWKVLLSRIQKLRFISVPCTYVRNNAVFVLSTVKRHHYGNQQTKNSLHREIAHFAVQSHSILNDKKCEVEDIDKQYLSADLMKNVTVAACLADKCTINSLLYSFFGHDFIKISAYTEMCFVIHGWESDTVILSALLTLTGVLSLLPGWRSKSMITSGRMP